MIFYNTEKGEHYMIDKTVCVDKNDSPEVTVVNNVPYIVYESAVASHERITKRLFFALIFCIVLLFVSNGLWLYYESQFETLSYEQDGNGINSINTNSEIGDITNEPTLEN